MKAYTDINQSKRLEKILPNDSADLHWQYVEEDNKQLQWFCLPKDFSINQHNSVPAWSVTALLSILPKPQLTQNSDGKWMVRIWDYKAYPWSVGGLDNPIDACYEMIIKLHELKLL